MPKQKHEDKNEVGGIAFVGSLFIGLGLGIKYNQAAVGVLLGLGIGFILMAILRSMHK